MFYVPWYTFVLDVFIALFSFEELFRSNCHFYDSSQTTWYVEFDGTGVGGRLRMYIGL